MPTSADELPMAQEALRLGDREMDLAFAAGIREAQEHPAILSVEAKESQRRLQDAEVALDRVRRRHRPFGWDLSKPTSGSIANMNALS